MKIKIIKIFSSIFIFTALVVLVVSLTHPEYQGKFNLLYIFLLLGMGTVLNAVFQYQKKQFQNQEVFSYSLSNLGVYGWLLAVGLTVFYVLLYWFPSLLGYAPSANTFLVALFDPLSLFLKNEPASQWFMYGTVYTGVMLILGAKFMIKYRHHPYQLVRTVSVLFFQLAFAFLIPELLLRLNLPSVDIKNMWPLDYDFFYHYNLKKYLSSGGMGLFFLIFGLLMIFIISPLLTYFYGKRWYCSWVCGCGGLAETAGDTFRHLSDSSLRAWKIERWTIHIVLVLVVVMTLATLYSFFNPSSELLFVKGKYLRSSYGFFIGGIFSGVVGVGFYPLLGSRVWCRFGCPMAAILGIQQRFFSRFRITTNGGQCISCGNCTTYCEQGIDVRWYAQREQNIVRASCVGCGICAEVCPRGVLKLENKNSKNRL